MVGAGAIHVEIQSISASIVTRKQRFRKSGFMFLRECKICHCSMDAGEGQNGKCDDCISRETERQNRKAELDWMVRSTNYEQMRMEEFLNV